MTSFPVIQVEHLVSRGGATVKTGPFGTQLSASEYVEQGIPVINVRNVGFGDIRDEKLEYVSSVTRDRLKEHVLRAGDIVFGRKGAVERHAFIQPAQDGWVQGSDCLRLRLTSPDVDSRFASYYLLTEDHKTWMKNQCSHGATMASLNQDIVGRINLPAPPLPIQRRIAAILSAYDDLIENNRKRIAILEDMARSLYREWFVHFRYPGHESVPLVDSPLGRIPQGWENTKIENVCSRIASGATPSRGNQSLWVNGTIDWYKTQEILDADLLGAEEKVRPGPNVRIFDPGTIFIALYGASIGRLGLLHSLSSCNQAALGLLPDGVRTCRSHLYYTLFFLRDYFIGIAQGAAQQNISKEKVAETAILAPPAEILKQFEAIVGSMLDLRYNLSLQISTLRRTRDLLLPRLMSGTLSVDALATAEAAAP